MLWHKHTQAVGDTQQSNSQNVAVALMIKPHCDKTE